MTRHLVAELAALAALAMASRAHADPPRWTIQVDGAAGVGSVNLPAARHVAAALDLGIEADYWWAPHLGVGLRWGDATYGPLDEAGADERLVHWNDVLEPELLARSTLRAFDRGRGALGLVASAGLGMATVRTLENRDLLVIGHHVFGESRQIAKERDLDATLGGALAVRERGIELAIGLRAQANGAGDFAIGPSVSVGVSW